MTSSTNTDHHARIGKLLRQAERAGTEGEAETFMAKAQLLASRHAIQLEVARQHIADTERRPVPVQRTIKIGDRGKKLLYTYVQLFGKIADANDVEWDVASDSTRVYCFGFDTDIELVEALYDALVVQMVAASEAYLRKGEWKSERVWVPGRYRYRYVEREYAHGYGTYRTRTSEWVDAHYRDMPAITARKSFQEAFATKVGQRLRQARQEAIQAAEDERSLVVDEQPSESASTSTALVLANKAVEVRDFYKQHSNARGHYRGGEGSNVDSRRARNAGRAAGSSARLGGERAIGGRSRELRS
jgi:hypothetical protein